MFRRLGASVLALSFLAAPALAQTADPNQWLEAVEAPQSMQWVGAQNAKTLPILTGDKRYAALHADALKILSATDRIAMPHFEGETVFNFWQDAQHVRGIWRRTTLASYRTAAPQWETVLDLDALAKAENANWIWKGAECRGPKHDRCLIELSNGGKDAVQVREFDLGSKTFVSGGFVLPESKQTVAWLDDDTLILTRDWGGGSLTESGYGFVVKTLRRGQTLDQAAEVYRGEAKDVSAQPRVLKDGDGNKVVLIERATDFFHTQYFLLNAGKAAKLPLPERSSLRGFVKGQLIVSLEEDWNRQPTAWGDKHFEAGALISVTPAVLEFDARPRTPNEATPSSNACNPCLIARPGAKQSIDQVAVTANDVVVASYDNVRGRLARYEYRGEWGWKAYDLDVPDNASISLVSASDLDSAIFYTVESFLSPTQLRLSGAPGASDQVIKTLPARFAAADLVAEQHEATSKDGTKIPYFIVHKKGVKHDGSVPTLVHAYGGFQLSKLPVYDPLVGKLWLERGGAYVVANIRGGGEFGPAWHEAALKENRQRAYDDYFAVAQSLIDHKITSPRRMGAYGRSNGGLLMGVALTQRPDLWNAVVVESPLLDMLRYDQLPAGASWIGEYGDPKIAAEAAWIAKYSPYQNIKPSTQVKYPLAYVTTSTKDDRVHPGHARKFAARLGQEGQPYLYFENTDGGHANGADPRANAKRWAMHYVYLTRQLMD